MTEYGLSLSTLDQTFSVRINRYKTKELDSRGSEVGTLDNRYLDMEGRPSGANVIQPASFRFFVEQIVRGRGVSPVWQSARVFRFQRRLPLPFPR